MKDGNRFRPSDDRDLGTLDTKCANGAGCSTQITEARIVIFMPQKDKLILMFVSSVKFVTLSIGAGTVLNSEHVRVGSALKTIQTTLQVIAL